MRMTILFPFVVFYFTQAQSVLNRAKSPAGGKGKDIQFWGAGKCGIQQTIYEIWGAG
jgi:hypothetical protein